MDDQPVALEGVVDLPARALVARPRDPAGRERAAESVGDDVLARVISGPVGLAAVKTAPGASRRRHAFVVASRSESAAKLVAGPCERRDDRWPQQLASGARAPSERQETTRNSRSSVALPPYRLLELSLIRIGYTPGSANRIA